MNSATLGTPLRPRAAWTSAISPWVLPPPKLVSSRKMAATEPPWPARRAQTLVRSPLRPRVGYVLEKKRMDRCIRRDHLSRG